MINIIFSVLLFAFFIWFALVSIKEKESLAIKMSLLLAIVLPIPFLIFILFPFSGSTVISIVLLSLMVLGAIILLLPIKGKFNVQNEIPTQRFDERDTMFSRKEITNKSDFHTEYYKRQPDKLELDKEWFAKPGLMSEKSTMYSPLTFTAANATFYSIEQLRPFVDGEISLNKKEFQPDELSKFITNWAKKLGAVSVGFTEMKDYH